MAGRKEREGGAADGWGLRVSDEARAVRAEREGEVGNGLRSTEPGAGLPARLRGLGRGAGMDRGWAQVAGWAAVGFGVCFPFHFSILILIQTTQILIEFKTKFEFKPYTLNQIKEMLQHECTNIFILKKFNSL